MCMYMYVRACVHMYVNSANYTFAKYKYLHANLPFRDSLNLIWYICRADENNRHIFYISNSAGLVIKSAYTTIIVRNTSNFLHFSLLYYSYF